MRGFLEDADAERSGDHSGLAEPLCVYIQEEQKTTLSSRKREDRLLLARRVCEAAEEFYRNTWGEAHTGGRIFTRYLNEVLDECEKLPGISGMSRKEKLDTIRNYASDPWVEIRGEEAVLSLWDYRILWYFLKRKRVRMVYLLCAVRRWIVKAVHELRRRKSG